ncbi:hypothetical protein EJ08DRAFT_304496 [Tothia fuscella]|uniref:Uncharacterized protein n=1 Tax=Tothia fuscella TaxID=1048955 RepID=A0A9P4NQ45_9PEZI|nr:hypothetical protein EJ08DRAFT_304496 [Tothia fuscella]
MGTHRETFISSGRWMPFGVEGRRTVEQQLAFFITILMEQFIFSCPLPNGVEECELPEGVVAAPVFGMVFSSMREFYHPPGTDGLYSGTHNSAPPILSDFAVKSPRFGKYQCVDDIVSLFMLEVASRIKRISGTTKREVVTYSEDPGADIYVDQIRCSNSVIESILECLMAAPELFPDRPSALRVVIPAFVKFRLLPNESTIHVLPAASIVNDNPE